MTLDMQGAGRGFQQRKTHLLPFPGREAAEALLRRLSFVHGCHDQTTLQAGGGEEEPKGEFPWETVLRGIKQNKKKSVEKSEETYGTYKILSKGQIYIM